MPRISGVSVHLEAVDGEVRASGVTDGERTVFDATTQEILGEVGPNLGMSNANQRALLVGSDGLLWILNFR